MTAKKKPGGAGGTEPGLEIDTRHSTRFNPAAGWLDKPSRHTRTHKRQWKRGRRK